MLHSIKWSLNFFENTPSSRIYDGMQRLKHPKWKVIFDLKVLVLTISENSFNWAAFKLKFDVMGVRQWTLTKLATPLHSEFSISILKLNVKRAPVMSIFIEGLSLLGSKVPKFLKLNLDIDDPRRFFSKWIEKQNNATWNLYICLNEYSLRYKFDDINEYVNGHMGR